MALTSLGQVIQGIQIDMNTNYADWSNTTVPVFDPITVEPSHVDLLSAIVTSTKMKTTDGTNLNPDTLLIMPDTQYKFVTYDPVNESFYYYNNGWTVIDTSSGPEPSP